ncbi:MAG TPA: hypothetical protein ENK23_04260 [Sorangium sp.]|nr:hypothetical protein [Sorangium sp.]
MNIERRTVRSTHPCKALGHFLAAEAQRRSARAVAVGTVDGLPLAAWGDDELRLAAVGALFASGQQQAARQRLQDVAATTVESVLGPLVFTCCGTGDAAQNDIHRHLNRILTH